jgi:hypothetical protein
MANPGRKGDRGQVSPPVLESARCDFNSRNYCQFQKKLDYIHGNPVKQGLCEKPEDWPWSSARDRNRGRRTHSDRVGMDGEETRTNSQHIVPSYQTPNSSNNNRNSSEHRTARTRLVVTSNDRQRLDDG